MKKNTNTIPIPAQAQPASFRDVQRATSLAFYLRDHLHIASGKDLLTELMQYVRKESLELPAEFCASLSMTVCGEYGASAIPVAA